MPEAEMAKLLPIELCEKILLNNGLDVKDLLRFKCVCRDWNSLISSFNFVRRRLELSQADPDQRHHKILQTYPLATFDFNAGGGVYVRKSVPVRYCKPDLKIVGSSDGLVCSCSFSAKQKTTSFVVWNPCTREAVTLSEPVHREVEARYGLMFYGFGRRDPPNSIGSAINFKLVLGYLGFTEALGVHYVLYSLINSGRGSSYEWRIRGEKLFIMDVYEKIGTFLDGVLHWPANDQVLNPARWVIVSYDWSREKILNLRLPDVIGGGGEDHCFTLGVFDGCLSVLTTGAAECTFEVWVMKLYGVEESWSKLMVLGGFSDNSRNLRPLGYSIDGDLVALVNEETLVKHCSRTNDATTIKSGPAIGFVESLVSPKTIVFK